MNREARSAIRRTRAARVNAFIVLMGSVGRRFWAPYRPRADRPFGYIEIDDRGRPWWLCPDSDRRIYLLNPGHVPHVGGGTLRDLLLALTGYVMRGEQLDPLALGPWPTWVCGDGDRWRYGLDNMAMVRAAARALGILAPQRDTVHLHVDVDVFTAEWLDELGVSLRPPDQRRRTPVSRGEVCERLAKGAALELASGMSRAATRALLGKAVASAGVDRLAAARVVAAEPLDEATTGAPTSGLCGAELEAAIRAQLEATFPALVWSVDVLDGAGEGSAVGQAAGSDRTSVLVGFTADEGISLSFFGRGAEIQGEGLTMGAALTAARGHLERALVELEQLGANR